VNISKNAIACTKGYKKGKKAMKPNTIEVICTLIIKDVTDEIKGLVDNADYIEESDSYGFREMARNCRNIIDAADALENLLLTAADEIDRIEIEAREADAVEINFDPLDQKSLRNHRSKEGEIQ
jgi:hypothetical protein